MPNSVSWEQQNLWQKSLHLQLDQSQQTKLLSHQDAHRWIWQLQNIQNTINNSPTLFKVMFNESKAQIQAPIFMTKP